MITKFCMRLFLWVCLTGFGQVALAHDGLLWSQQAKGAISSVAFSKNGKAVVVATNPDPEISGNVNRYLISRYQGLTGKTEWTVPIKGGIRDMDISEDGSLVVASNYANEINGFDSRGKLLWSAGGTCRPMILQRAKKILCYHDDDASPQVAFDLFDWTGRKISSFPIQKDILALKVSEDEKYLAIGLTGGQVLLLGAEQGFTPIWQKKVDGEIVDVAVSSGVSPHLACLMKSKNIVFFSKEGQPAGRFESTFNASQIEFASTGKQVFYYGNSRAGQFLGSSLVGKPKEMWKRGGAQAIEYSYSISIYPDRVVMGYEEDLSPSGRESRLREYSYDGDLKLDLSLHADEGSYLYAHRIASSSALASPLGVVVTDDGKISLAKLP